MISEEELRAMGEVFRAEVLRRWAVVSRGDGGEYLQKMRLTFSRLEVLRALVEDGDDFICIRVLVQPLIDLGYAVEEDYKIRVTRLGRMVARLVMCLLLTVEDTEGSGDGQV